MLDIQTIREQPDAVKAAARQKKAAVDIDELLALDEQRRALQPQMDALAQRRNALAKEHRDGKPSLEAIEEGKSLKRQFSELEKSFSDIDAKYAALLHAVPNLPSADTPVGENETENVVLRTVGEVPAFSFPPKEHWQLGDHLGLIDNERAARISGSRFTYLKGDAALLEFALLHFALSVLTSREHLESIAAAAGVSVPSAAFIPVVPPVLVKPEAMQRMARLEPREDRYYVPSDDLYLVGSAEHALGPIHMDETLPEEALPIRYVGFSSAFRREAGSYGKDVHGILRMHQFDKIEMESFTTGDQSTAEQDFFVAIQEYLLQQLGLPYRVVIICTGDMGPADARQIDVETWFPGQNRYRETHTADLMTDYQARRLKTKVRRASGSTELVHMNDATVLAMGRTIAAILENNQRADGSVAIPPVLRPYFGNRETFAAIS